MERKRRKKEETVSPLAGFIRYISEQLKESVFINNEFKLE